MIALRRLLAVTAFLAVAALLTSSDLWGEPGDKELTSWRKGDKNVQPKKDVEPHFAEDLDRNRFADQPVVVYQDRDETYFALQLKPVLAAEAPRPTDFLVIVDTSASKALNASLGLAKQVAAALAKDLGADDRMALWTANLKPRDLSRGFKSGKDLEPAIVDLGKEIPLGAVDLKKTITEAAASFEVKASRRRVILYLGDGKSVAQPLDADTRAALCEGLVKKQVGFYSCPLGDRLDAQNLHGLMGGTGGKAVRLGMRETPQDMVARLKKDVAQPILYNAELKLPAGKDILPSQLPPLRGDAATLVMGKLEAGTKTLNVTLTGDSAGKAFETKAAHKVPAGDSENRFLVGIHGQWKGRKDRPALLHADRALAYAHKQNQLAVEDLTAKAELALEHNQLDVAEKLYQQSQEIEPDNSRARGGLALIKQFRDGKKKREDVLKELRLATAKREVLRVNNGKREIIVLDAVEEKQDEPKGRDALDDVKARKKIAEQLATATANEAIRQATRLVRTNPDEAYRVLEQALADVKGNTDIDAPSIRNLEVRLSNTMRTVKRAGDVVKRDQAEALALRAAADARLDLRRTAEAANDRVRERMRVFKNLMDQAREEEAARQALTIRNDLVNQGLPVPTAVTAGYQIGLTGYHLRELTELKRLREEKFLAVMLEVERSHVPFPDEPPVEYPSSAVIKRITRGQFDNWKDWSKNRISRYAIASFGSDVPGRLFELRNILNKTVDFGGIDDPKTTLVEALDQLSKVHRVTFDIRDAAFKYEMLNDVAKVEVANPNPLPPLKTTFGTVLKKILARVNVPSGATYLIRRDVIEITTGKFAETEKAVRVYPVADLVTPIPNSFNQQAVSQVGTILGSLGQIGLAGGGVQLGGIQLGGIGGLQVGAALGGIQLGGIQLGGIQLGGVQLGIQLGGVQLGGVQLGGVQVGIQLGAQLGGQAVGGIQLGGQFQGNVNLGVGGGGLQGFTGGQLGQLGNLGGQFGLQGGDQSQLLITLIRQVVGRPKDWSIQYNPITGQPLNPLDDERADNSLSGDNNNLGYYPPALALVVKAPTTVHTRESNLVITGAGGGAGGAGAGGMARLDGKGGDVLVDGKKRPIDVANDGDEKKGKRKPLDPKETWERALVRGVNEPGLIIATTDYLAGHGKFDHTAEFLKANLKQGIVVKPWVYKSLAIALRETGGSADEIERAEVSAADLEPLDANGYLVAARALAEDKNYERAIGFCKQAVELAPGVAQPLADAARYAEIAGDDTTLAWAAGKLLAHDWPLRNDEVQASALQKVEALSRRLGKAKAEKLQSSVDAQKRRDLVIKLVWQGDADFDLKVLEPSGSVASSLTRQTVGGGTLIASGPGRANAETYVASHAFSGEYKVTVDKVWGKAIGDKVQVKIIRHQGTKDETEQLVTIKMTSNTSEPIPVELKTGRRNEVAYVPPPSAHETFDASTLPAIDTGDATLNKLRALADPEVTGMERPRAQGGVLSPGQSSPRPISVSPKSHANDRTLYQTKVSSFVQNSLDVTAQSVLSADRQSVRLSLTPVFNTARPTGPVKVNSPVFPGGTDR